MNAGFKIGVELELLLQPTRRCQTEFKNLTDFALYVVKHCNDSGFIDIHNDVHGAHQGSSTNEWSPTDDISLENEEGQYKGVA